MGDDEHESAEWHEYSHTESTEITEILSHLQNPVFVVNKNRENPFVQAKT